MTRPIARTKAFDCVKMKLLIQERIHTDTQGMGPEELLAYFRKRVASSRFARSFTKDEASKRQAQ